MWRMYLFLMSVSLVFGVCFVKEAQAEGLAGGMKFIPMFLDQGFLGRDVDLDLQSAGVRIRFKKGDIPASGVLTILSEPDASSTTADGLLAFGQRVRMDWTTAAAESPAVVDVTLVDKLCGATPFSQCAIQEVFQGKTRVIRSSQVCSGSARAKVRIGAMLRLVEVNDWMPSGDASWYAYKKCLCAASPDFPKGTYVKVTRSDDQTKSVVVRINDFGPERNIFPKRVIDLDKVAFAKLASTGAGVIQVSVKPLASSDPEAIAAKAAENKVVAPTSSVVARVVEKTQPVPVVEPTWSY